MYLKIKRYFRHLRVFHKLLVEYNPYDHTGVLIGMKCAIDDMNKQQTKDLEFKSVNQAKYSKRMSITSNSLGRLIEDYYTDLSCFEYKVNMSDSCCFIEKNKLKDLPSKAISDKVGSSQRELDLEIVSKSISKYLCTWWS